MENTVPETTASRVKTFVKKNRVPITAITTAAATTAVFVRTHVKVVRNFNEFLDKHGLKDEFYNHTNI